MGDITNDNIFDSSQVTAAAVKTKEEPPATAARRQSFGLCSSAKHRGSVFAISAAWRLVASTRQPGTQAPSGDVLTKCVPPQKPLSRLLLLPCRERVRKLHQGRNGQSAAGYRHRGERVHHRPVDRYVCLEEPARPSDHCVRGVGQHAGSLRQRQCVWMLQGGAYPATAMSL